MHSARIEQIIFSGYTGKARQKIRFACANQIRSDCPLDEPCGNSNHFIVSSRPVATPEASPKYLKEFTYFLG
jgi:hypothetical protein